MITKIRKMKRFLLISLIALISLTSTFAQTGGYQVGDAVASFKLKNIDGRMVSLADYNNCKRSYCNIYEQSLSICKGL